MLCISLSVNLGSIVPSSDRPRADPTRGLHRLSVQQHRSVLELDLLTKWKTESIDCNKEPAISTESTQDYVLSLHSPMDQIIVLTDVLEAIPINGSCSSPWKPVISRA